MRDSRTLLPTAPFVAAELFEPRAAIAAYRARIALAPLGIEDVDLDSALGRVLARDAVARDDHPSHARSTMDGFAIATAGGAGERRIVGEIRMGEPPPRAIARDETLRIPTGGALPAGADAVVPLEDVTDHGDRITIRELPPAGDCQTPRASDIRAGEAVIGAGRRIGGPELGVLATLGITRVPVYRRPRFAIVSTGDELIDPGETPRQGQVRDSNRYAIAGALRALGVDARHFPRAGDTPASLRAVLADALAGCDGVVLTGGSSVGLRDLVPRIVAEFGDPGVVIHGIRVKPGKPTMLGAVGGKPIVGLPGNPTSSLMILEAVIRPLIHDCTGERSAVPCVRAIASLAFTGRAGWTWYVPARLRVTDGELSAEPLRLHSAHVSLLARAGGYVVLDERRPEIAAGEPLDVRLFAAGGAPPEGLAP